MIDFKKSKYEHGDKSGICEIIVEDPVGDPLQKFLPFALHQASLMKSSRMSAE